MPNNHVKFAELMGDLAPPCRPLYSPHKQSGQGITRLPNLLRLISGSMADYVYRLENVVPLMR